MDPHQALDDLKTIRQIMDRTQKVAGGHGGWFMILAGVNWLIGFTGSQFLSQEQAGRVWAVTNVGMMLAMVWVGLRLGKHRGLSTPLWKSIFSLIAALVVFAVLLAWLFGVNGSDQIGLLILLIIAMGYVQIGVIFQYRLISTTGVLIALLTVGAHFLLPAYFSLAMATLGGGLLIGSGLVMVRAGR